MNVNVPPITPDAALQTLLALYPLRIKASACAMMWGASGVGKSSVARAFADAIGGKLALYRLGGKLPEDLRGIPRADPETGTVRWHHDEELPTDGKGVLFLDEINCARVDVQNQSMEMMLDRSLGRWRCPDGWFILAAGNEASDGASVFELPVPVADRMFHLKVVADRASWSTGWAMRNGIAPEVLSFLQARPELFDCSERRQTNDHIADASPRGWEAVSHIVKTVPLGRTRDLLVAGKIGAATQADFTHVLSEIAKYASVSDLMKLPEGRRAREMPKTLETLHALAWGLAYAVSDLPTARTALSIAHEILAIKSGEALPLAEVARLSLELINAKAAVLNLTVQVVEAPEYRRLINEWDNQVRTTRQAA